jgi:deoxyribonuclease V
LADDFAHSVTLSDAPRQIRSAHIEERCKIRAHMVDVLAVDVQYYDAHAKAAGVVFGWIDDAPRHVVTTVVSPIAEYVPGEFYRRELPCIMAILQQLRAENIGVDQFGAIVVDGHVFTDDQLRPGLGAHLWSALDGLVPVIGVAKTAFHGNMKTVVEVFRGESSRPLFVSSVGVNADEAAALIEKMHGKNRFPTILKLVDSLARS